MASPRVSDDLRGLYAGFHQCAVPGVSSAQAEFPLGGGVFSGLR
jgi:hypothetical protein